ncbi:hypothetical protein GCM10023094_40340 [Rhodococcus olei]|uniref:Uncharacterized protein n=1 Tax=Rhodococcus olei TaxID=2161675 RepID=A0ABP8PC32_9NOCA
MKTSTRRITRYLALPVAALTATGAAVAFGGVATASALPTISMTITNDSNVPIHLANQSSGFGWWSTGPHDMIPPHTTEILTATTQEPGGTVDVTYQLPGGAQATFTANNFRPGVDLDGTGVSGGGRWGIDRTVRAGYPDMSATYNLFGTP